VRTLVRLILLRSIYEYRQLTSEQRAELVQQRLACGFPPHSPPHPLRGQAFYLLTAACYEHACNIDSSDRRQRLLALLFGQCISHGIEIRAWVVLPNHYHLLAYISDFSELPIILRRVHGKTSRQWNIEDNRLGRKVWYRYTDRAIRSERHYYTTLNYIHYNPVKHKWEESPYDWVQSSISWYLEHYGRDWLRDLWVKYPVQDYGRGWDV
jgi:putative transposase